MFVKFELANVGICVIIEIEICKFACVEHRTYFITRKNVHALNYLSDTLSTVNIFFDTEGTVLFIAQNALQKVHFYTGFIIHRKKIFDKRL